MTIPSPSSAPTRTVASFIALLALTLLPACKSDPAEYARPLPPGVSGLRKLDPKDWPDLRYALPMDDAFVAASKRSLGWFAKPSSQRFFPLDDITHDRARASVFALPHVAWEASSTEAFVTRMYEEFDIYESIGWDGSGTVLFTGYYSPVFPASKTRTAEFRYPLYKRPADLVADQATGEVRGRQVGGQVVPYPTRGEIEANNMLAGGELVYLRSRLDAYIVEVQGSAKLQLTDGTTMLIGFAGSNGREYTSIGRALAAEEKIDKNAISLPAIRDFFQAHPETLDAYIRRNERFVFFTTYDTSDWPAGSLGVKVEPRRSIATDKSIFPRGCVTLVVTKSPQASSTGFPTSGAAATQPFHQLMLDQDTGGAIRAAGRADLYFGVGPDAEAIAGRQVAEGKLYYILLKPARIDFWLGRMKATP